MAKNSDLMRGDDGGLDHDDLSHLTNLPSSSIKSGPVILAGNALQLQLDDSDDPVSFAYGADTVTVSPYISSPESSPPRAYDARTHDPEHGQIDDPSSHTASAHIPRPLAARVRFRSRVRITSGMHRHRERTGSIDDSSGSGSPSSSISAPLRYNAGESTDRGPLAQRLSLLASNAWHRRQFVQAGYDTSGGQGAGLRADANASERTPLMRGKSSPGYGAGQRHARRHRVMRQGDDQDEESSAEVRSGGAITFGRWPWRAFDRHVSPKLL